MHRCGIVPRRRAARARVVGWQLFSIRLNASAPPRGAVPDCHVLRGCCDRSVHRRQSDPRRAVSRQPRRDLAAGDGHRDGRGVDRPGRGDLEGACAYVVAGSVRPDGVRRRTRCCCSSTGCSLPVRAARRRHPRLPAGLRRWAAPRVRLLAHRDGTVRSAHRQEAIRPDRRRRHAGRSRRRLCCRARRERVRRRGHAARARDRQPLLRVGDSPVWPVSQSQATSSAMRRRVAGPGARGAAVRAARAARCAVPAESGAARAARHARRGARRLPVQGAGGGRLRPGRKPDAVLRDVLRGDESHHVRAADLVHPVRARAPRPGSDHGDAVARGASPAA